MSKAKTKFIILVLLVLMFPFVQIYSQGACSFSIKTTVSPVDCRANGVITVTMEGEDLGSMQDFMYRAYPSNANPNDYDFITNNVISGLVEGDYIVEAKAFCTLNGVNVSQQRSNVKVPRTVPYVEPDFSFNPNQFRKSLPCLASGTLYMQGIKKGKGPYTIRLKNYPATYTGNKLIYQGSTLGTTYTIDNLSAGTYVVELSDGCGSTIEQTAVVENVTTPFPANYIGSVYYGSSLSVSDTGCYNLRFYASTSSSYETYYYARYGSQYYEYALFYTGDDVNDLEWKPMGNAYNTVYMEINTRYSISEMRLTADKRPKIYIRVKGADCGYQVYSPNLYSSYISTSSTVVECGVRRYTHTHYANAVLCYPYTFTVRNLNTADSAIVSVSEPKYYTSTSETLLVSPGDKYLVTLTDASGFKMSVNYVGATATNASYISSYTSGCNLVSPYIYTSGGGTTLAGATIEFLRDQTDPRIPTPTHSNVTLPKNYSNYFYPYSDNYSSNKYLPSDQILPTGLIAYFKVTDSCGISKTLTITGPSIKEYVAEPIFNVTQSCGRATIKISNLREVLKNVNSLTGVVQSNLSAYAQITSQPSGADVIYSYSSNYLRSSYSDDYVQVNKSGTYRFTISSSSSFYGTSYCLKQVDVDIVIPEMEIDEATTAAYRCPGSAMGTGYMDVKVKNGSGNYLFTLYSKEDLNTPLATSTSGVFTSWPAANTDYYTIKVEDLTCGRSMTHSIFVYDLGNATLGWPEDNIFIKCLGDHIKLYALALGETTYTWTGPGGWVSTEKDPVIPTATLSHSGLYTVTVGVPGCGSGATVSQSFRISIADKIMYWNPDAVDNNWYNTQNWLTSTSEQAMAVPAPCTTVHIAGNATKYPNLDKDSTPRNQYGYPSCDTIIFHYGSETIYPHFLKYNRAKVQYNFNYYQTYIADTQPGESLDLNEYPEAAWGEDMPVIKRAQWYTIGAPLKQMTGGDFGLAGYPNFYQRLYNTTDPQRGVSAKDSYTLAFNTQNVDLATTAHAMALWVPDYDPRYLGLGDHKHLQALKGVLEMPYFLNPKILAHRPLNQYNVADSTSLFQYYDEFTPTLDPVDKWDSYRRGYKAFRFVFENDKDTVSIHNVNGQNVAGYGLVLPTYEGSLSRVMIGNPLMCHINFDKIYEINSDIIEDHYMITNGATQLFETYRVSGVANELDNQIAPLQGFIVTLKSSPGRNYLLLPFEGSHSVITPSMDGSALPKPRSSSVNNSKGWLNITTSTPPKPGSTGTSENITTRSTLLVNYAMNNIPKVIFPEGLDTKAEVYLIGDDGYLNTEQVVNGNPEIVKIGLESLFQGNISMSFSKDRDGIIDRIFLVDKYLNTTRELTDKDVYVFKHRYNYKNGIDNDRFELRLTYKASSISELDDAPVIIHANRSKFIVQSSGSLNTANLYNAVGECLVSAKDINETEFVQDILLVPGVYVASVTLNDSTRIITQKIVVQ